MFLRTIIMGLAASMMCSATMANEEHSAGDEQQQIRGILDNLLKDNEHFVQSQQTDYFQPFLEKQTPRATVVTCADSRVHTHAFDKTPDNDLFMVRNIGNQHATAEGSIEYGVQHLKTPVLVFVGHTVCGAVRAAMGDYSELSEPIKRELDGMSLAKQSIADAADPNWIEGVRVNVDNQVSAAVKKYAKEIEEGKLAVVGAVYDFRNDLKQGYGKLIVTNVNGETNPEKINTLVASN